MKEIGFPLVSVIIPVFNVEEFLVHCISSVLRQTYNNFELILVDDGSTDKSGKICDGMSLQDSRVRVFHKNNGGVSSARNLGIEKARGKWITFIDSDDWVEPDYISELLRLGEKDFKGVSLKIEQDGSGFGLSDIDLKGNDSVINSLSYLWDGCFRHVIGKMFRYEIIKNNEIRFSNELKWGEDTLFVIDYLSRCNSMQFISNRLYNYRVANQGLTSQREYWDEMLFLQNIGKSLIRLGIERSRTGIVLRKFGYYHFQCLLKTYVLSQKNICKQRNNLKNLCMMSMVKEMITCVNPLSGLKSRIFDYMARKKMFGSAVLFARLLKSIGKPLC